MRKALILSCLTAGLVFAGCSKTEVAEDAEAPAADASGEPTRPVKANPALASALDTVDDAVASKQYDQAVETLVGAKMAPKTEREEKLYQERLHQTTQELLQKSQTDPQARQAYESLGRVVQGR